jgi:hypothetical protein
MDGRKGVGEVSCTPGTFIQCQWVLKEWKSPFSTACMVISRGEGRGGEEEAIQSKKHNLHSPDSVLANGPPNAVGILKWNAFFWFRLG